MEAPHPDFRPGKKPGFFARVAGADPVTFALSPERDRAAIGWHGVMLCLVAAYQTVVIGLIATQL